ncbi:MAG: citrate transporter [Thiobacillaceae bacterium]|nr:citrate transporter [Thiobacillaceae bacterium]MCX7672599.1 citrate transporter [Thiobacillaceae bacterium]MDW8322539.1 citrate transporter [Burkholderiales bacterium]
MRLPVAALVLLCSPAWAYGAQPTLLGIPLEFFLFAATLLGVALWHRRTLPVALAGLAVISLYKIVVTGFREGVGLHGWLLHLRHEWVGLSNLLALLLGFAVLARHFEASHLPQALPRILPSGWRGGFALLALVFVISAFLDNIAAALIGGTVAAHVYRRRVHVGYLAAIVAASNAGGSGSVVGDTTTTMMWIDGVAPLQVVHAYVAALAALLVFGLIAARQQHAYQPIVRTVHAPPRVDWSRIAIVVWILAAAVATNITVNSRLPQYAQAFPFLGAAVWLAILTAAPLRRPEWRLLPEAAKGSVFLLSLVLSASMMPVEHLPPPSWASALGLGFVSAVFDNIPLTALALAQGGYDWGVLAFSVGYGGSMIWFGSSAGVALANLFPEARSVGAWLKAGWHVALGYLVGFFVMLGLVGWHPHAPHKVEGATATATVVAHTPRPCGLG